MKKFLDLVESATEETLRISKDNYHAEGLFSLVIGGEQNGTITRVFIAKKKIKPFDIALHTRCYDSTVTFIKGSVKIHTAVRKRSGGDKGISLPCTPLNGGDSLINEYLLNDFLVPPHSVIGLSARDIITISCNKGSIWIEEGQGLRESGDLSTVVLSPPFTTDHLYTTPTHIDILKNIAFVQGLLEKLTKD